MRITTAFLLLALAAAPARAQDADDLAAAQAKIREAFKFAGKRKTFDVETAPRSKGGPYARFPGAELFIVRNQDIFAEDVSPLNPKQRKLARAIFDSAVDLDAVRVAVAPTTIGAAQVMGNTIRLPKGYVLTQAVFLHELTHVWQYQTMGSSIMSDSGFRQVCAVIKDGDRNGAYAYELEEGKSFFAYTTEQQAMIVEDFSKIGNDSKDAGRYLQLEKLLLEMRQRSGIVKFKAVDAVMRMELDSGLGPKDKTMPEPSGFETPFNGETSRVPQFELRF